jgi:hypothetical protein
MDVQARAVGPVPLEGRAHDDRGDVGKRRSTGGYVSGEGRTSKVDPIQA